jgi:hypothetical protein
MSAPASQPARTFRIDADLLEEIEEYLDDHSDAEYVDGIPRGNKAMKLLSELRQEMGK